MGYLTSTSAPLTLHWQANYGGTPLTIGDTVNSYFTVTPTAGDVDTSNNYQFINDTIRAGCDPNEMWVSPAGCIASGVAPTQLKYTINFENTGNDTAHNIYVMDTLPGNVDVSTMGIVMASNEMYITKLKDAAGNNVLKFDFPNINLLDSSHHGKCDGAVIFTINTKAGLPDGATITNRAGIYFDVNAVVMTNSVSNGIGCPVINAVSNIAKTNAIEIRPNPASNILNIDIQSGMFQTYTITNGLGTVVMANLITDPSTPVNIKQLPAGVYYIKLMGDSGVEVREFVKM